MDQILTQLQRAIKAQGLTLGAVLERSGLGLDYSSLNRKINGKTPMTITEMEALARALDITIAWVPTPHEVA